MSLWRALGPAVPHPKWTEALRAAEDEKAIVDTTPPADPLPVKPAPAAQAQGPLALWSSRKGTAV